MDWKPTCWLLTGAVLPSFLTACIAGYLVRWLAPRWGLIDRPSGRKAHDAPTPLGGGLAIWLGVVTPLLAGGLLLAVFRGQEAWIERLPEFARPHVGGLIERAVPLGVLLGGGTVLMLVGLVDDARGLDWRPRLAMQFLVATVCVVWQGWQLTAFIPVPAVTIALSVCWIVILINAFNMLDNMDGASAGVAAIAAAMLAVFVLFPPAAGASRAQWFVGGLLLVLLGALLGFLWHNRPPARLFMGDAGSYFIGFGIAVATLLATYTNYQSTSPYAVLAPLCVMAVPLYDMTTVILIRLREGRSIFQADRCHFSHRLVDLGFTRPQAVATIYLTTATCGLGALLLNRVDPWGAGIIMLLVASVLLLIHLLESTARRKLGK